MGRVPPSDVDAEKAVLSAIMLDNTVVHTITQSLRPDDFYHPAHQLLYQAMVDLGDKNQPVDVTVLADYLKSNNLLDQVGGIAMLAEVSNYEATPANVEYYAGIVRDKSVKRSLIHVASEIVAQGYEDADPADELLDTAETQIFALSEDKARTTLRSLEDELHGAVDHIDKLMDQSGELTGLPTGFSSSPLRARPSKKRPFSFIPPCGNRLPKPK